MKAIKGVVVLIIVAILATCVAIDATWIYLEYFSDIQEPEAGQYAHLGAFPDEDGSSRYFMELNKYTADQGKGYAMTELIMNSYVSPNSKVVKSRGIQCIWDEANLKIREENAKLDFDKQKPLTLYYYEKVHGGSSGSLYGESKTDKATFFAENALVGINNEGQETDDLYKVDFTGTYLKETAEFDLFGLGAAASSYLWDGVKNGWNSFTNIFRKDNEKIPPSHTVKDKLNGSEGMWEHPFTQYVVTEHKYTTQDFFLAAESTFCNSNFKDGDFILNAAEVSEYFSLMKYDPESGQFKGLNNTKVAFESTTFDVKVHLSRAGVTVAAQSIFGLVEKNPRYNTTGLDLDLDYGKAKIHYTLSPTDFNYFDNAELGGKVMVVKPEIVSYLAQYPALVVDVKINLDDVHYLSESIQVVGIAAFGLSGLDVASFTITATKAAHSFFIGQNAFANCGMSAQKGYTVTGSLVNVTEAQYIYGMGVTPV